MKIVPFDPSKRARTDPSHTSDASHPAPTPAPDRLQASTNPPGPASPCGVPYCIECRVTAEQIARLVTNVQHLSHLEVNTLIELTHELLRRKEVNNG